jgi:hypothetical protein
MDGLRAAVVAAVICIAGCSRQDRQLQDHQDAFASLSASTKRIVTVWLDGSTSGTFTITALDQMLLMVEQERSTLTASPQLLIDPRGGAMADSASQLSHQIAAMINDVRSADGDGARRHLDQLPFGGKA